jgi:gluconolactonase
MGGTAPAGAWDPAAIPTVVLEDARLLAEGLTFPEGPVALADGSVLVTEIDTARLTRIGPDGDVELVLQHDGGPNGAAVGPDGMLWVCNNGGRWASGKYDGGWIERVDVERRTTEIVHRTVGDRKLSGPNDIVFDADGGAWVTDTGKGMGRIKEVGSVHYLPPGLETIREVIHPAESPNGVGLSPDGGTLYYAETGTGRLRRRRITGPGEVAPLEGHGLESLVVGLPGHQMFDSLAVDAEGNVCVATFLTGVITSVSPDGRTVVQYKLPEPLDDWFPTNLCFGGPDLRTAYITLAHTGRVVTATWPTPGLRLNFNDLAG